MTAWRWKVPRSAKAILLMLPGRPLKSPHLSDFLLIHGYCRIYFSCKSKCQGWTETCMELLQVQLHCCVTGSCTSTGSWMLSWQAALAELPGCNFITAQAAARHSSSCFPWGHSSRSWAVLAWNAVRCLKYNPVKELCMLKKSSEVTESNHHQRHLWSLLIPTLFHLPYCCWLQMMEGIKERQKSNVERFLLFSDVWATPWAVPRESDLPHGL